MSSPISPEVAAQIEDLVFAGKKIAAIKLYREHSGKDLKEAKDFIEALERELRAKEPDKFAAPATSKGCFGVVLLILALGGIGGAGSLYLFGGTL